VGADETAVRAVLDTNVVVSALLFDGRLSWIREAWKGGRITPLVARETVDELIRVLAYPKFRLSAEEIEDVLADFLPYAESVERPPAIPYPALRSPDPDDQIFLDLAAYGRAELLVSGDPDLASLATEEASFRIVSPAELKERVSWI